MIEVNGLSKRYGIVRAIDDVSFKINEGEIVGFLGPNGAGKTTTMNIITGYLSATSGSAVVSGYDILKDPIEVKKRIGYLPEQPPLYLDMTVRDYLDFMYDLKRVKQNRKQHIEKICELVKIENVYPRLIKNLSKGYRQRVGLAQALLGSPPVLILDEPTVGLDPKQIIEIRNLITGLGKSHTIILSTHILSEAQSVCNRVIIINRGKIAADGTASELSQKLSSDTRFDLRVAGPRQEVSKMISKIKGVKEVVELGERETGSCDFTVIPDEKADVRREVFARLADRNWPILNLRGSQMTLEDVFIKLTTSDVF